MAKYDETLKQESESLQNRPVFVHYVPCVYDYCFANTRRQSGITAMAAVWEFIFLRRDAGL